jgi:predicted transcriptional regulator
MLDLFITSKTRRKIITVFTKYPDYRIHVRGLAKLIKEDPGNVQRELSKLEHVGFVKSGKESNTKVYYANSKFILYKDLQSMVLKSQARR